MTLSSHLSNYYDNLHSIILNCQVHGKEDSKTADDILSELELDQGLSLFINKAVAAHLNGKKLLFVGNGGSAGICSHMATDYSKNGGIRSLAFNDGSVLTCLGNDYGYEHVFEKQIEWHAHAGDVVVTISSSGGSKNILNAAQMAASMGCFVVTLSGFRADNPLRRMGNINFYLNSSEYGFVEVGHLALLHAALDLKSKYVSAAQ